MPWVCLTHPIPRPLPTACTNLQVHFRDIWWKSWITNWTIVVFLETNLPKFHMRLATLPGNTLKKRWFPPPWSEQNAFLAWLKGTSRQDTASITRNSCSQSSLPHAYTLQHLQSFPILLLQPYATPSFVLPKPLTINKQKKVRLNFM